MFPFFSCLHNVLSPLGTWYWCIAAAASSMIATQFNVVYIQTVDVVT